MIEELAEADSLIEKKASSNSLVKSFSIHGLYGYRTVSLESPYAATILIARNGAGKTTLISALHAVLKAQFSRLQELNFKEIRCEIEGVPESISISRKDLDDYFALSAESEISKQARRFDIDPIDLCKFIAEEYPYIATEYRSLMDHPVFSPIYRGLGYDREAVNRICESMESEFQSSGNPLHVLRLKIQEALSDVEVIYLPTYRRIELPLDKESVERRGNSSSYRPLTGRNNSLLAGDMQFGLSDISEHLSNLNSRIQQESNFGYRRISADIISELMEKDFDEATRTGDAVPQPDELSLFFSRLKDSSRRGPFMDDISIPNVQKANEMSLNETSSGKFLKYFLGKLNTVIQATQDIEVRVQDFIDNCNKYLSSQDISTSLEASEHEIERGPTPDDKVLRLNKRNLSVYAESLIGGRRISLDSLSSGEKQMVSLFAKLYLYTGKKIVLIDEPELSLSMHWQKKILVDVMRAPLCSQILAITHSPFVFDNVLEPYARSLDVDVDISALPQNDDGEN